MDLSHAQSVAVETAKAAGDLLGKGLNNGKVISRKRSAVDLLTEYDQAAETIIVDRLKEAFPDHRLVSEESDFDQEGSTISPYTWYIDPLDGTNNFAHGYPVFSVSIALYKAQQPIVGVVYDPLRDECFSATEGRGAYLQNKTTKRKLEVSLEANLLDSLLATGFPFDRQHSDDDNLIQLGAFLKRARGIRRDGSAALDLAYVAAGRFDGFWEFKLGSWDVAAGICLILEAGGKVTGINGGDWQISPMIDLIASNGRIHRQMVDVLAKTPIPKSQNSGR